MCVFWKFIKKTPNIDFVFWTSKTPLHVTFSRFLPLIFFKTSKVQHTHVSFPHHYNRTRFYQKNMHEITILHRNFVCFSIFSEFTICQPILILQFHEKIDEQYLCKIFLKHICKITICNINYHEKVICIADFNIFWIISSKFIWIYPSRNNRFLKKKHRVKPFQNGWFLSNFEEKT